MVNNAAIIVDGLVLDTSEDDLDRVLAVNFKGVFFGCQAALRVMIPQGSGSIINVASAAIDYPNSNVSVYAMTTRREPFFASAWKSRCVYTCVLAIDA